MIGAVASTLVLLLGTQAPASPTPVEKTPWGCAANDGRPFGPMEDRQVLEFERYARERGLDLQPTADRMASGDRKALAEFLRFSLAFQRIDGPARTYGNMVWSVFLNLGERRTPVFVPVLKAQDARVRQRIEDILWFPTLCIPASERRADSAAENERDGRAMGLWGSHFVFGKGDPVFGSPPQDQWMPIRNPSP